MDARLSCGSPREDGELEDGEICDDEAEEKQQPQGARPGPGPRKPKTSTPRSKPAGMGPGKDFRPPPPFRPGPMLFPACPSGPDRLEPPSPRTSFWERSHGALGRLRYRGRAGEGRGDRARGAGRGRNIHRKDSPNWKQKQGGRAAGRKPAYVASKPENGVDESFEDLLKKYKQIQLELECIRNQERRALKPSEDSPHREQEDTPTAATPQATSRPPQETNRPEKREEQEERKAFQAFNLRPLRQKLLTPAERDALKTKTTQGVEQKEAGQKEVGHNEEKNEEVKKEAEKSPVEPMTLNEAEEEEEEEESSDLSISLSKETNKTRGKLPRHKAVVVRLNASDDSDSEIEASSSAQCVFGGLESMIKEARRTVEAARPRPVPVAEKENNPLRTQDTLPEGTATEYRLLRAELTSWENQRIRKSDSAASSPVGFDSDVDLLGKPVEVSDTEEKLAKHHAQLQKDQALLEQLLQQELRKKESLKLAEAKVVRLKEQLLAAEKVASANRVLLRKLQEQLPRHKAVVVRLNASDDSDSEIEASSSAQCVFGGLESMIKEARRTVEAARPRPVPVAEKENNPLRTQDTLPEGTATEYRLLRAELTSWENQRIRKSDSAASSPVGFDSDVDLLGKPVEVSDTEEKLAKHHAQLQKDQALLEQLLQQELRKKESLKLAEAKVVRLKEQLLAAEKVASANRVLLRKLQEQAGKRRRVDLPDSHYADLMAQKKRLQQLESEYALKIQKLKEAQALRQANAPIVPCGVTQPSLHDLTQDKLTLASDDPGDDPDPEGVDTQPANATTTTRRRSFRESGSFTKPNLSHAETPVTPTTPTTPTVSTKQATPPAELLLFGLNVEDLRLRYQQSEMLPDLLRQELRAQGGALLDIRPSDRVIQVDFDPMAPQQVRSELKPVPFGPYRSPLLVFRSYRFSPYFRTKEKLSLSSITYSHAIEPRKCFCRFDLTGTCNDDDCQWQHMRNCTLNGNQLFQDILSYSLPLIGCSEESATNDIIRSTEKYIKKLFGANKDRMGSDQKAVLLVSKVNESLRHVPPFTTHKQRRKWRPEPHRTSPDPNTTAESEEENITISSAAEEDGRVPECRSVSDVCVTQDDKRYFDSETDDISNLEYSVLDSPRDRQLWIKLAYRYLNQKDTAVSECVDAALNTLSRALEDNREDEELWCHYLTLFSRRGSADDVREMCDMAVEHAAHYTVWWTGALMSEGESAVSGRLTLRHRCLAWLCHIHLCEFGTLPEHLYDPANSNPSRIVSLEHFLFPWNSSEDVRTPPERLITQFQDALSRCVEEGVSPAERTLACLPLHLNLLHLHRVLGRLKEATALCESMLAVVPHCCPLLEILSELHAAGGDAEEAASVWLRAHRLRPHDARVFYSLCKCLHTQEKPGEIETLFKQFVSSLCDGVQEDLHPAVVLRHLLCIPSEDLQHSVPSLPEQLQDQLPYLHLTHSFWQSVRGSAAEAVEAFEAALGAISDLEVVKKLWLDYLLFTSSKLAARDLRVFSDLVQRCLNTMPTRTTLPYDSATYWSCYSFHNQVISFYLSFLPPSLHSSALERFRHAMPSNIELSLRVLQQEWSDDNVEYVKLQTRLMTATVPTCLSVWKIAVAVQKQQKGRAEVQKLYQQSLQKLPLCAALWKDWLLFEAAAGGKTDTLNKLVAKCQDVGLKNMNSS
ncbi:hypothetical protein PDJAM_G00236510 [Pangasius djambal]|uniref:Uncharacterized protein n=1 Tax=Pangasius djambal TaxID=1691987 RepID=A0ACC5YGP0_9TELE|nr:hypothetical protein [Pangasius djambal]